MTAATGTAETEAAEAMLKWQARKRIKAETLGGDKRYNKRGFVTMLHSRKNTPHVARNSERRGGSAINSRTKRHVRYSLSQRFRKKVEEIFGWIKVVGGFGGHDSSASIGRSCRLGLYGRRIICC